MDPPCTVDLDINYLPGLSAFSPLPSLPLLVDAAPAEQLKLSVAAPEQRVHQLPP